MNQQLPPEANQLGELQAEYTAGRLNAKIILGAGIVSGLFSLLSFSIAIGEARATPGPLSALSDSFSKNTIMINTSLGLLMLLFAVFFFVYYRYQARLRVVVYSKGFVFSDWRKSLACRWDEATELYESISRVRYQGSSRLGPRRYTYTVCLADGRRIKTTGLAGALQLGQRLKAEIPERVLRQAIPVYQAGGTVWFGKKLNLSQQGIGDGEKTLSWGEVAEVKLDERNNNVTIRQEGQRKIWKYVLGSSVANPWVFKAMVDGIDELNRPSEQPAAGQEPLHFPPDFPAKRARELKQRRTKIVAAVAILLIGCLAGGGYAATRESPPRTPHQIRRSLENICADVGARVPEAPRYTRSSGLHPVMYFVHLRGWSSRDIYSFPSQWHPQELTETELVACLEEERIEIEQCPYTLENGDTATLVRLRWETVVTLREARTGKVIAVSGSFISEPPPECQESHQFEDGKLTEYVGTRPEKAVVTWLRPYVVKE